MSCSSLRIDTVERSFSLNTVRVEMAENGDRVPLESTCIKNYLNKQLVNKIS